MRAGRRVLLPVAAGAGLLAWPVLEPHLPAVRRARVPVLAGGSQPVRVLHVSDLHLQARSRRRAAWVRRLARLQPDLVVSTGDHWSSTAASALVVETLSTLTAGGALGVFVPGNNDYYCPRPASPLRYLRAGAVPPGKRTLPWAELAAALTSAGWVDLTHRRSAHQVAGTPLLLAGTDDSHLGRDRYERVAGAVPSGVLGIGVLHTPSRRLLQAFAGDGFSLLLAGHTHGGQVRLPLVGAVVTNCDLPRHRARGLTLQDRTWLHVSGGLGTSPYVPVRVACRPEATLLELVARPEGLVHATADEPRVR